MLQSSFLITYSDADFAANQDDRTSMRGQLVFLDTAPIMWKTSKQKSVCLSTMESFNDECSKRANMV